MSDEPTLGERLEQARTLAGTIEARNEFLEVENIAIKQQIGLLDRENVRLRTELERAAGYIKSLTDKGVEQTRLIEALGRQIIAAVPNLVSREIPPGRPLRAVS